jgi:hypothetical protein
LALTESGVTKAEETAVCTVDDSMNNIRQGTGANFRLKASNNTSQCIVNIT